MDANIGCVVYKGPVTSNGEGGLQNGRGSGGGGGGGVSEVLPRGKGRG